MRVKALLLVVPPAAVLAGCGCSSSSEGPIPPGAPSVLLVTLDTTRADRLGCYGYAPARTPNLDALAASGVRFERAYSHVPLTLPSHSNLMSGVLPLGTGLHVNFQGAVHPDVPLLAEMFAASGYRTGAFLAAWVLNSEFGLNRGFQVYDDLAPNSKDLGEQVERTADEVTDAALAWLSQAPEAPFFAWVHYFDAHDPYSPPSGFQDAETPYDGELAFLDSQLGRILAWLDAHGRRESTLVVVAGDHGEGLGDHEEATHGIFIYDSTMHVPLIMSWPGNIDAHTVSSPVGLIDIHPTIVELCGGTSSTLVDGSSLVTALRGGPFAPAPLYAESEYSLRSFGWAPLSSLRTKDWVYIEAPRPELYDTATDPGELTDLSESEVNKRQSLRGALHELRASLVVREAEGIELTAGATANLAALGYVEGTADIAGVDMDSLQDPKDLRHVFSGTMRAKRMRDRGEDQAVVELLTTLLEDSPESGELWGLMASSLLDLKRFAEARDALKQSLLTRPETAGNLSSLGEAYLGLNELELALEAFTKSIELSPEDAQVHSRLALIYAKTKRFDLAEVHYRKQCELSPDSPNAHTNLANVLLSQSRFDEGLRELDAALALDQACEPAWMTRLQVLHATKQLAAARETMSRCLAATPDATQFHRNLSAFAEKTGDAELIGLVRQALESAR